MKKQVESNQQFFNSYGARELKEFQKKAVSGGFAGALIFLMILGIIFNFIMKEHKKEDIGSKYSSATTYIISDEFLKNKSEKQETNINSKQIAKAGSGMKAGNPKPVEDENNNAKKIEFADVKMAGVSFTDGREGDKVVVNTSSKPTHIVTIQEPAKEIKMPDADDFIIYEKEAVVDLADLAKIIEYPQLAKQAGIQGNVTVQVLISQDGTALNAKIIASDNAILDKAAIDAVMKVNFIPAIQNGQKVPSWLIIPIVFKLRN